MNLLITMLVGALNALVAIAGVYLNLPRFFAQPSIETATAFIVAVLPFAATTLFAFGKRTKAIWVVSMMFNALAMLGMIGLIALTKMSQSSPAADAFVGGLSLAGAFAVFNLAYLLWRMPAANRNQSVSQ